VSAAKIENIEHDLYDGVIRNSTYYLDVISVAPKYSR